jgi:glycosyltransferase involved in cell wall biosynthesis
MERLKRLVPWNATMTSISVVVPVYNGTLTIRELTERLANVLPTLATEYELIFVEDNGHDNSWEVIRKLASEYSWVRGIKLMRNYGQHNALLCGIRGAQHEIIVTMDDDLQHPPEEIPQLLTKLDEGYDVV